MAKKSKKKAAPKPAKKAAKKAGKKMGKKAAKKSGGRPAGRGGPMPVKMGAGSSPAEIGAAVVESINAGRPDHELWDRWWSPRAESIEGGTVALCWTGRKAIEAKNQGWSAAYTIHSASAEGPYLGASGFAVKYRIDAEEKATGKREVMEEVGVYTVQKGKVVREEFMYGSRQPVAAAPAEAAAV
jgi:hypothetical protein